MSDEDGSHLELCFCLSSCSLPPSLHPSIHLSCRLSHLIHVGVAKLSHVCRRRTRSGLMKLSSFTASWRQENDTTVIQRSLHSTSSSSTLLTATIVDVAPSTPHSHRSTGSNNSTRTRADLIYGSSAWRAACVMDAGGLLG